uniref:Uncharacterized protein n=1 Tax=Fundulus heteroclitus TaxID=8078 RepID=A0A3Q2P462_FUNHE
MKSREATWTSQSGTEMLARRMTSWAGAPSTCRFSVKNTRTSWTCHWRKEKVF